MTFQKPELWLNHLSQSLKASRQLAYLWHVEEDRYEFMGDAKGVLGLEAEQIPDKKVSFSMLINPQNLVERQLRIAEALGRCASGDVTFSVNYSIRKADGSFAPVCENGVAHFDLKTGKKIVHSLISVDAQALEQQLLRLRRRETKDKISYVFSGANGRQAMQYQLEEYLDDTLRPLDKGFVLAIGIDRLSLINEAYGTAVADEVIAKTGTRLEKILGDRAFVSRISGDVFGVFFDRSFQGEMADIANNVLNVFYHQPIETLERSVQTIITIGGYKLNENGVKASSVIGRTEMALKQAQQQGRGCFVCYNEKMSEEVSSFRDALSIGDDFLRAFRDGRVKLAFQAIMGSKTNRVSFHECLVRLVDEDGTIHSAGKFISAIEKMGLTRVVDHFCVQSAIKELKMFPEISLSVNVSNHTLTDPLWLHEVTNALRDQPDVAARLIVEITESVAMIDINQTIRVTKALEELGCRIALDDFGAGQTAFTQLRELPVDIVKIDKSFVQNMDKSENMLFIKTLQALASGMDLETVGEGAETLAEADILMKGGIDHIQGFAYSMPSIERIWLPKEHPSRQANTATSAAV